MEQKTGKQTHYPLSQLLKLLEEKKKSNCKVVPSPKLYQSPSQHK